MSNLANAGSSEAPPVRGQLLVAEEVADMLNVSKARVYELAKSGVLPVVHLGRQLRFDPVSLGEFLSAGGRSLPGGWRASDKT